MVSLKLNLNKAIQHSETLHSEAMSDNIAERSQKVVIGRRKCNKLTP